MKNLKITILQTSLHWEDIEKNLAGIYDKLAVVKKSETDLIVLPEMFTTGFTMNASAIAETMDGTAVRFLKKTAKEKNAVITGSVVIMENGNYFNRLLWVQPDGNVQSYDKRHLFRMANEQEKYTAGLERKIFEINGWKICPLICYDLRFPVWSRNNEEIDLLFYVANWPSRRRYAWKQLLIARAIENQCYVAGVNRVGIDGNDVAYAGESVVLDALGDKMSTFKPNIASVETIILDYNKLNDYRKQFPVMLDADQFKITE